MSKGKFNEIHEIKTFDADFKRRATPTAILGYMQEIATNHAETLGLGYHESWDAGFIWILRSARYVLYRTPMYNELVTIATWPVGMDKLKALRRFSIKIGDDLIGEGFHYWLMLDKKRNRPVINEYYLERIKDIPLVIEDFYQIEKIETQIDMKKAYLKRIMNYDIDWNHHVNNVRYADIIFNAIPNELLKEKDIKSFQIDYLKELKLHDLVEVNYRIFENAVVIEGVLQGTCSFRSYIEFME